MGIHTILALRNFDIKEIQIYRGSVMHYRTSAARLAWTRPGHVKSWVRSW